MKKAILFDLDGTLWDSTGCAAVIWNRVLEGHPEAAAPITPAQTARLMGKTMAEIGQSLFPALSDEARQAILEEFEAEEVRYLSKNGAVLYAGVCETLEALAPQYSLYIVSNCQEGYIQAFLKAHALESLFQDFESSGRTGLDKAQNIQLVMARNALTRAAYVGDTAGDEVAAHRAGLRFIWARYGFGKAASPDDAIDSLAALPKCIEALI